jgi:hypothetical protein
MFIPDPDFFSTTDPTTATREKEDGEKISFFIAKIITKF